MRVATGCARALLVGKRDGIRLLGGLRGYGTSVS
jgi:hypothetical protein